MIDYVLLHTGAILVRLLESVDVKTRDELDSSTSRLHLLLCHTGTFQGSIVKVFTHFETETLNKSPYN